MNVTTTRSRRGFTIVEILIVVVIIIILAGLLLPAVLQAVTIAKKTATRSEVQGIGLALEQYRDDFAVYPPSCIWWEYTGSGSGTWPEGWTDGKDQPSDWVWYAADGADRIKMNGAECLLYFLGGGPFFKGFRIGTKTFGPYKEPQGDALFYAFEPPPPAGTGNRRPFRSIQDPFRQECAYLYFKADRSQVGSEYDADHNSDIADVGGEGSAGYIPPAPGQPISATDGNYYHSASYQIISAGPDGRYARPATAGEPEPSEDDVTN